tara:strand:+ start:2808 stop:3044 length:237 start_codon:yes stop_codon:yes gene_type:complete
MPEVYCVLVCDTSTDEYSVLFEGSEDNCNTELLLLLTVEKLIGDAAVDAKHYETDAETQIEAELALRIHLLSDEEYDN